MSIRTLALVSTLAISSASGCSLLVRAAKGELTPVGVDAIDSGGIAQRSNTLVSSTDPQAVATAFRELGSAYLYKCLEKPSKVPSQGNQELRKHAGEALLGGLQQRVARQPLQGDVSLDAEVADLQRQIASKCGDAGLAKHDPEGRFAAAAEIATSKGRVAYVERTGAAIDASLDAAIASDANAVRRWVDGECAPKLPAWDWCVPHAAEKLYSAKQYETLFVAVLDTSAQQGDAVLGTLAQRVGEAHLVNSVRDYLLDGRSALPSATRALDRSKAFLEAHDAWGDCNKRAAMWRRALAGGSTTAAEWALDGIVADKCRNVDDAIVKALGSDQPYVRAKAAWAVGELSLTKAKKHMERLQWSDPYLDQGCWCHPVRDAAKQAYNKLELGAG